MPIIMFFVRFFYRWLTPLATIRLQPAGGYIEHIEYNDIYTSIGDQGIRYLGNYRWLKLDYLRKTEGWLKFYPGWVLPCLELGIGTYFDSRVCIRFSLGFGSVYWHLPIYTKYTDDCDPPKYGFYWYTNDLKYLSTIFTDLSFVWCWGRRTFHFEMPWSLTWVRTSRRLAVPGTKPGFYKWISDTAKNRNCIERHDRPEGFFWGEQHPYTYILKGGDKVKWVQERVATIGVEEREWRPRWTKWLPIFARVRRTIDVEFSDEVGERSGSWKGGTIGCSYEMLPGEQPVDTLRRMERERKFN